jgi:hypothetical protein
MVGHRATAIFKEIFPGERPTKRRMSKVRTPGAKLTADTRYWANLYPRGVIEQAFAQVVEKLTKAGTIDRYCPSSDDLRHFGCFRKGGSGSSVVECRFPLRFDPGFPLRTDPA